MAISPEGKRVNPECIKDIKGPNVWRRLRVSSAVNPIQEGRTIFSRAIPNRVSRDEITLIVQPTPSEEGQRMTLDELNSMLKIRWGRVPGYLLNELLVKTAKEVGIPPSMLHVKELLDAKFFGRGLKGLVSYIESENPTESKDTMQRIRKRAGISQTGEDIIYCMKIGRRMEWSGLDKDGFGNALDILSNFYKKPSFLWGAGEYAKKLDILGGRNAMNLYHYIRNNKEDQEGNAFLLAMAGREITPKDIAWAITLGKPFWHKVPQRIKSEFIGKAAEAFGISPSLITDSLLNHFILSREVEMSDVRKRKQTSSIIFEDTVAQSEQERKRERTVDCAKRLSFLPMGSALLDDLIQGNFSSSTRSLEKKDKKSRAFAPLAKIVAEAKLRELGLEEYITLDLGDAEEVKKGFNRKRIELIRDEKTDVDNEEEIEARRAVIGYKWKEQLPLEEDEKWELQENIVASIKDASKAQEEIATVHKGLVKNVLIKFHNTDLESMELFSMGTIGLVKAIQGFDWRKENAFSTYAIPLIRGEISHGLRDTALIKPPREVSDNFSKIQSAFDALTARRDPLTLENIASEAKITPEEVLNVMKYRDTASRPTTFTEGDDTNGDKQEFRVSRNTSASDFVDNLVTNVVLEKALTDDKILSVRERVIVKGIFYDEKTQTILAGELGCSQMTISTELRKALGKMKQALEASD